MASYNIKTAPKIKVEHVEQEKKTSQKNSDFNTNLVKLNNSKERLDESGDKTIPSETARNTEHNKNKIQSSTIETVTNTNTTIVPKTHSCKFCNRKFKYPFVLTKHMRNHVWNDQSYKCLKCCEQFMSHYDLQQHNIKTHPIQNQPDPKSNQTKPPKNFECIDCNKKFQYEYALNIHRRSHTGERPYVCPKCSKTFTRTHGLRRHMRVHFPEIGEETSNPSQNVRKTYRCEYCDKKYACRTSLKFHIKHHKGEKGFECVKCKKNFMRMDHLRRHMRSHAIGRLKEISYPFIHSTVKTSTENAVVAKKIDPEQRTSTDSTPCETEEDIRLYQMFDCEKCNKQYQSKAALKLHMRLHTGETPYECSTCQKKFTLPSNYQRHVKCHLTGTYKERKPKLPDDPTVEKKHKCQYCNKGYLFKTSLILHIRTHTGEKPYECSTCRRRFSRKDNLQIHMHTHTKQIAKLKEISSDSFEGTGISIVKEDLMKRKKIDTVQISSSATEPNKKMLPKNLSQTKNNLIEEVVSNNPEIILKTIKVEKTMKISSAEYVLTARTKHKSGGTTTTIAEDNCFGDVICKEEIILPDY